MNNNKTKRDFDIASLVEDLQPVQPLNGKRGLALPLLITAILLAGVGIISGFRPDLMAGNPAEIFLLRAGILLLLGVACAHAVIAMASPSVGRHNNGWQMAIAGALLFPLAALIVASTGNIGPAISQARYGMECLMISAIGAFSTAIPMVIWLRRGAPTSPNRAGWLTGIASGGLGAFAYNFHCQFNSIVYIGLWYGLAVTICAIIGRLVVPRLIRW